LTYEIHVQGLHKPGAGTVAASIFNGFINEQRRLFQEDMQDTFDNNKELWKILARS